MPVSPDDLNHATQSGVFGGVAAAISSGVAGISGYVFKQQNRRISVLENARVEAATKMATKDDIEELSDRIDRHHDAMIDRIIDVIKRK